MRQVFFPCCGARLFALCLDERILLLFRMRILHTEHRNVTQKMLSLSIRDIWY